MYKWGSLEVPELEYRARIGGNPERWPAEPGIVHLPTGMRMNRNTEAFTERGQWQEWHLYPPAGEDWLIRVTTAERGPGLHIRLKQHLGIESFMGTPSGTKRKAEQDYLRRFGDEFICYRVAAERGTTMPEWTPERREALLWLLFWSVEKSRRRNEDPYRSTMLFYSDDVPQELHGTYLNPAWERMQ